MARTGPETSAMDTSGTVARTLAVLTVMAERGEAGHGTGPLAVEVRGAGEEPVALELWDVGGRRITGATLVSGGAPIRATLSPGALHGGVYLVTARANKSTAVTKVVWLE